MAANFLARSGRNGRRAVYRPMSDINVTPLVDVMLVLLIVFMVTAPLLTAGVPVDLPQTNAPQLNEPKEPLLITVTSEGKLYLGSSTTPLDDTDLVPRLQAVTNNNPAADIYVKGDRTIQYGRVLEIMGMISGAGFTKVSLLTQLPQGDKGHGH